jgi:hypothetical protein
MNIGIRAFSMIAHKEERCRFAICSRVLWLQPCCFSQFAWKK